MVQEHNNLLFPVIEGNNGKIVKTIGDSVMASFEKPEDAVKSSIKIQQKLFDFNQNRAFNKQVHIRIGINQGKGIVEENDIFGDVVNIAARIEPLAEPNQILISKSVYNSIKNSEEIICRHYKSSKLRGKSERIEIYRIIWTDEERLTSKTRIVSEKRVSKIILPSTMLLLFLTAIILAINYSRIITGGKLKPQIVYSALPKESSFLYLDFANRAFLLERGGKTSDAIVLYKKALELNPNDEINRTLLVNAEKKLKFVEDKEHQEKIDSLVKDLISQYQKKKSSLKEKNQWKSQLLTMTFVGFEKKGERSKREGEDEFLSLAITNSLQERGRIKIIEREALDKLLKELKLSQTNLADKQAALRVGKILSAKLISTGSIMRFGDDIHVSLRIIETETSSIKFTLAESFNKNTSLRYIANEICKKINEKIAKEFPLKGEVTSSKKNSGVSLDIGFLQGVNQGLQMKAVSPEGDELGKIEIVRVFDKNSIAKILSGQDKIKKGIRVVE